MFFLKIYKNKFIVSSILLIKNKQYLITIVIL